MTNISVVSVIICKFSYWEKSIPIIVFKVDNSLEIGFHSAVLFLCPAIDLELKSGEKSLLDI